MNAARIRSTALSLAVAAALTPVAARAVTLGVDGTGQALIYPYYTARAVDGGQFNTYLSVVNSTPRAKAVRVTVREGRLGRAVAAFNLFLAPNDVWTGAIVPSGEGARLVSNDVSCTEPAVTSLEFHDRAYSGANADSGGTGLDRTREGYVEMIEMATLTGASAAAVTHTSAGIPANCPAVQPPATLQAEAPTGGLSGTLTVIDVLRGMDFTVNAEALDELARQPYYRPSSDPSVDFNSSAIERVSVVMHGGFVYRSLWAFPVDAVSAVLMRAQPFFEYTLERTTRSETDIVVTMPTRHIHSTPTGAGAPFPFRERWHPQCASSDAPALSWTTFNREEYAESPPIGIACGFTGSGGCEVRVCASSAVATLDSKAPDLSFQGPSTLLGSLTRGLSSTLERDGKVPLSAFFQAGWVRLTFAFPLGFYSSLPSSTRTNLATGETITGPHTFHGLPLLGFAARTFRNNTLPCSGASCQGNFGGAFPFRYRLSISP